VWAELRRPRPAGEWPEDGTLDFEELRRSGWAPTPFRQFLFKVHSRCNLNCSYCYVYHLADQSWRDQPKLMAPATVEVAARRIREHVEAHGIDAIGVVLHGGEPLLAGLDYIRSLVGRVRLIEPAASVHFGIQTNAVLVDEHLARFFHDEGMTVGVSLDGDPTTNDLHRRYRDGSSSYQEVARGLRLLTRPEFRGTLSGILCTITLDADPLGVYQHLMEFSPPGLNFLLPHGNWSSPPPGKSEPMAGTPYADWLIEIFDHWYSSPVKPVRIRVFDEIISLLLGGRSASESWGLDPVNLVVVETDGTIEQVDSLKSAYDGAPATGLNVRDHSFDEALRLPPMIARQIGIDALHATCLGCPAVRVCGAGLYPHRYVAGSGFKHPSVYCLDLYKLIAHIREALGRDIERLRSKRSGAPAV
jgi:uncharacterized protein